MTSEEKLLIGVVIVIFLVMQDADAKGATPGQSGPNLGDVANNVGGLVGGVAKGIGGLFNAAEDWFANNGTPGGDDEQDAGTNALDVVYDMPQEMGE